MKLFYETGKMISDVKSLVFPCFVLILTLLRWSTGNLDIGLQGH